jgi:hypothetical protein
MELVLRSLAPGTPGARWGAGPRAVVLSIGLGLASSCASDGAEKPVQAGGTAGSSTGGGAGGGAGTSWWDASDDPCRAKETALVAFVQGNRACEQDADCTYVPSDAEIREHCAGGFYMNAGYDPDAMSKLEAALCPSGAGGACALSPFPALCWHGMCIKDVTGPGLVDLCVAELGGPTLCTTCVCYFGGSCDEYSLCLPILECALAAGCLGSASCDPAHPDFPCKDEVEALGGVNAHGPQNYARINVRMGQWQCAGACAAGN